MHLFKVKVTLILVLGTECKYGPYYVEAENVIEAEKITIDELQIEDDLKYKYTLDTEYIGEVLRKSSTNEELKEIIESYKWIKVKKFDSVLRETDDIDCMYKGLDEHHKKETEFLIKKCRELAKELLKYKK